MVGSSEYRLHGHALNEPIYCRNDENEILDIGSVSYYFNLKPVEPRFE